MANKNAYKNGVAFKEGNCANPLGAKAHSPLVKAARKLSKEEVAEMIEIVATTPTEEIENIQLGHRSFLEDYLLKGLIKGYREGDLDLLMRVLERVIGKVKEDIHITTEVERLDDDQLKQRAIELAAKLNG